MLVLSRRVGESVCVGPGVVIRVMETRGGRVRLAIDAPASVPIRRGELTPIVSEDCLAATSGSAPAGCG